MRQEMVANGESAPPGWSDPGIMTLAVPDISRAETEELPIINDRKTFRWKDPKFHHFYQPENGESSTKIEETVEEVIGRPGWDARWVERSIGDGPQPFSSNCRHEVFEGRRGRKEGLRLGESGGVVRVDSFYPHQGEVESVPKDHPSETSIELNYWGEANRPEFETETQLDFFYRYSPDGKLEEIRTIRSDLLPRHQYPEETMVVTGQITSYGQNGAVSKSVVRQETNPEIFGQGKPSPQQYKEATEAFFATEQDWNEITSPGDGITADPLAVATRIRNRAAGTDTTRLEDLVDLIGLPDLPTNPAADSTPAAESSEPTVQMPADDDDSDGARLRRIILKLDSQPKRTPEERLAELDEAYHAYVQARIAPTMAQIELVKAQANNTATEAHREAVQAALESELTALERLTDAMLFAIPDVESQKVTSYELTDKIHRSVERARNYLDRQLNRDN